MISGSPSRQSVAVAPEQAGTRREASAASSPSDRELDLSAMLSRSAVSRARSGLATATSNADGDATSRHRATLSMPELPLHTAIRLGMGHRPEAGAATTRRAARYPRACPRHGAGSGGRCLARRGGGTTTTACLRRRHTFAPVRRERLRCAFLLAPTAFLTGTPSVIAPIPNGSPQEARDEDRSCCLAVQLAPSA